MHRALLILAATAPMASTAQEVRELGAHEHGHSTLKIAVEGNRVAMELEAPGFDIVGFEHAASSAEDRATLDAAIAALSQPLSLFSMPAAAACTVVSASAGLIDEHDHEKPDHAAHNHDEHDHSDAKAADEKNAGHTEFHAEYMLECTAPSALDRIDFAFFGTFSNAEEIDVQVITDSGAHAFEVARDAPLLDLAGRI